VAALLCVGAFFLYQRRKRAAYPAAIELSEDSYPQSSSKYAYIAEAEMGT
jgi:hypothetical protein